MGSNQWGEQTWKSIDERLERPLIAILPIGAVEAHGPHLPLRTDGIIAEAMARVGAELLRADGHACLVLPTIDYTAAPFALGFTGTVSIRPETTTRLVVDIGTSLAAQGRAGQGLPALAIANAHFDPANLAALHSAVQELRDPGGLVVAFPDVTRKPWASRLTDEFKSGACHAGRYEGSVVMAERGDLVREEARLGLPENPVSLSQAIREGKGSFEEIGGVEAYFGDPGAATEAEGRQTVETLGEILAEAVLEQLA